MDEGQSMQFNENADRQEKREQDDRLPKGSHSCQTPPQVSFPDRDIETNGHCKGRMFEDVTRGLIGGNRVYCRAP